MAIGSFSLPTPESTSVWVRPTDWLAMPTGITSANQTFVGLYAIFPEGQNYAAFLFTTSIGQYRVDWGDGTVTLHNSNTIAQYAYDYATISNSTLTTRGYKQSMITVTAVSGNLLTCNLQQRYITSPIQTTIYSTGFLDCILSMPNAVSGGSIVISNPFTNVVNHTYIERFNILTIGGCTNASTFFANCISLQYVNLFNTINVTIFEGMFYNCISIKSIPLFNTINSTTFNLTFSLCRSLRTVPLFDTQNATIMGSMFQGCTSLLTVPLFNTIKATSMFQMFDACFSLKSVPLFNTIAVTNTSRMFRDCTSLINVPLFNMVSNLTVVDMFNRCTLLQSIPLFNTINVNNFSSFVVSCLSINSILPLSTAAITTTAGTDFGSVFNSCPSLDRIQMVFARTVNIASNQLSKTALVEIFTNLVNRTATTSATITITGNWGASALTVSDRLIATSKNWVIVG